MVVGVNNECQELELSRFNSNSLEVSTVNVLGYFRSDHTQDKCFVRTLWWFMNKIASDQSITD